MYTEQEAQRNIDCPETMPQEPCDIADHKESLSKARSEMPSIEVLYDVSELFKMFGDTTRIRILWALSEGDMCVCHLSELLDMGQSAISHQLRLLRQARLVRCRRDGKTMVYALDDDHVRGLLESGLQHIRELEPAALTPDKG